MYFGVQILDKYLVRDLNGSHGYANNKMSKNPTLDIMSNYRIGMAFHTHLLRIHRAFHNAYIGERIGCSFANSGYNFS